MTDSITDYGFVWGPMEVLRATHIEGRGYVVEVRTQHASVQVYVTEGGRKVDAFRPGSGKMLEPEVFACSCSAAHGERHGHDCASRGGK